jgi:hypothetical protein
MLFGAGAKGVGRVTEENRFRLKTRDPAVSPTRMGSRLWLGYLSIARYHSREKGAVGMPGHSRRHKKTEKE